MLVATIRVLTGDFCQHWQLSASWVLLLASWVHQHHRHRHRWLMSLLLLLFLVSLLLSSLDDSPVGLAGWSLGLASLHSWYCQHCKQEVCVLERNKSAAICKWDFCQHWQLSAVKRFCHIDDIHWVLLYLNNLCKGFLWLNWIKNMIWSAEND